MNVKLSFKVVRFPVFPALVVLLFLSAPEIGFCREGEETSIDGFLAGYFSTGNRKLDDERNIAGANGAVLFSYRYAEEQKALLDLRYFSGNSVSENNVREAYILWDAGNLTTRIGRQIIVWGRADRFNPTDVITPRNYEILSSDDDDQRFGATGVQARYSISSHCSLEAVALPVFYSSKIPSGILPPGIEISKEHQHFSDGNVQGGVKLDSSGEMVDWSVSYYNGFSLLPEIAVNEEGALVLQNRRLRMIGADFAAAIGAWGVRGEAARATFEEPAANPDIYPRSSLYTVLGLERAVWDTLSANIQWLHRALSDYLEPQSVSGPLAAIAFGNAVINNQFDKRQDGAALRLSERWLNDALQAEFAVVYFFNRHDRLLRPKISYAVDDHWKATFLADIYRGPEDSFLGFLQKNSLAYAELRYQF